MCSAHTWHNSALTEDCDLPHKQPRVSPTPPSEEERRSEELRQNRNRTSMDDGSQVIETNKIGEDTQALEDKVYELVCWIDSGYLRGVTNGLVD